MSDAPTPPVPSPQAPPAAPGNSTVETTTPPAPSPSPPSPLDMPGAVRPTPPTPEPASPAAPTEPGARTGDSTDYKALYQALKGDLDAARTKELAAESFRAEAEDAALRVEMLQRDLLCRDVAARYGLPPELAARLQGATDAEIDADAKKLSALVGGNSSGLGRGGLDPSSEPLEMDPRKLAEQISKAGF